MMNRLAAVTILALGLAACGNRVDLKPAAGQAMPVAPVGRADSPTAGRLLNRPPPQAPQRTVQLRPPSDEPAALPLPPPPPDGQ